MGWVAFSVPPKSPGTRTPAAPLPPITLPLSVADYALSLFCNSSSLETIALIDSDTGRHLSYAEFICQVETLAASLQTQIGLRRGDTIFILSPACLEVPVLYFSLFSLGVIIAPTNPTSTKYEVSRQVQLCKPVVAFATSATAHKLPPLRHQTVLLDSPEFETMLALTESKSRFHPVEVTQSDPSAILFSSGTTGPVKVFPDWIRKKARRGRSNRPWVCSEDGHRSEDRKPTH